MSDTFHLLIERYGLIALFLTSLIEGEAAALLGGFFAHQNAFGLGAAIAACSLGAFVSDFAFFIAGRRYAGTARVQRLMGRPGFAHALRLVGAYPRSFAFTRRFVYGLRLPTGVALGLTDMPAATFGLINAFSSILWAILACWLGYAFGLGVERMIGDALQRHESLLIGMVLAGGGLVALWWLARRLARRRRESD
ncbi:MAG: DedA family protein [Rhizobiaceae bacterium]|nr:DedA family protein [Rhizobiaceae bacterium]